MERWKILIDAIGEARHVVDLADHRARYALLIIGVLNAGVFAILSRGHFVRDVPASVAPWMLGVLGVYSILTVLFVLHAIDCLRPRPLDRRLRQGEAMLAWRHAAASAPLGILFWEAVARKELTEYRQVWEVARMQQLTAEAEAVLHTLSRVIAPKYRALHRLYAGLTVLVVMAGLILGLAAAFAAVG